MVEVPFAPFFLTQVLDNMKNSMYSYLDELPSLDPELYRNLTYVKVTIIIFFISFYYYYCCFKNCFVRGACRTVCVGQPAD